MKDALVHRAVGFLQAYVRGERTDDEIAAAAREDPELRGVVDRCLRCTSVAQELLEALDRSPFDLDLPGEAALAPTRAGVLRWLERVRLRDQPATALCDWAADALAFRDPDAPDDPVVGEILAELAGSEDDVEALTFDDRRHAVVRWHLERTEPALADRVALGLSLARAHDEIRDVLLGHLDREVGDADVRETLHRRLEEHRETFPTLVDDLIEVVASGGPDDDARVARIEALLACVARTADPIGCAEERSSDPEPIEPRDR